MLAEVADLSPVRVGAWRKSARSWRRRGAHGERNDLFGTTVLANIANHRLLADDDAGVPIAIESVGFVMFR